MYFPEGTNQFIHRHGFQGEMLFGEIVEYSGNSVRLPPDVVGYFVFDSSTKVSSIYGTIEELNVSLTSMGIVQHQIGLKEGEFILIPR